MYLKSLDARFRASLGFTLSPPTCSVHEGFKHLVPGALNRGSRTAAELHQVPVKMSTPNPKPYVYRRTSRVSIGKPGAPKHNKLHLGLGFRADMALCSDLWLWGFSGSAFGRKEGVLSAGGSGFVTCGCLVAQLAAGAPKPKTLNSQPETPNPKP